MLDLPLRQKEIRAEVDADTGAAFILEALTDEQAAEIMEGMASPRDDGSMELRIPFGTFSRIFAEQVRRAEEVQIAGERFDATNPDHIASIPRQLRVRAVKQAFTQDFRMEPQMEGNSEGPASPSAGGSTPPRPSPQGSAVS